MSEFGVLDLSGADPAAQIQREVRQRKRMASIFRRVPQLTAASAAMSMQNCRMGRNAALVMANEAFPNRAATIARTRVQSQNTGVPSTVGASAGPGEIRAVYSPEAYAAHKGWMPGAGVAMDTRPPTMGVRSTVTQVPTDDSGTADLAGCGCAAPLAAAAPYRLQVRGGACPQGTRLMWSTIMRKWVCAPVG